MYTEKRARSATIDRDENVFPMVFLKVDRALSKLITL